MFLPGKQKIAAVYGAAKHGNSRRFRRFQSHSGKPAARHQIGDFHLRALHRHFRSQSPGGIKHFPAAVHVIQPHPAGNGVRGVMPSDIFGKHQHFA